MASQIGTALAAWLSTRPGPIRAPEQRDVQLKAWEMSGMQAKGVPLDDFIDALARVGYEVQERNIHGGKAAKQETYHILCLPEKQAGSK